jgi:hypothetical protein
MKQLETIEDSALDNVVGGLGFNLSIDTMSGISATTPLGGIEIASPFTVAKNLIGGVSSKLGDLLTKFGGNLTQLGQLFKFS